MCRGRLLERPARLNATHLKPQQESESLRPKPSIEGRAPVISTSLRSTVPTLRRGRWTLPRKPRQWGLSALISLVSPAPAWFLDFRTVENWGEGSKGFRGSIGPSSSTSASHSSPKSRKPFVKAPDLLNAGSCGAHPNPLIAGCRDCRVSSLGLRGFWEKRASRIWASCPLGLREGRIFLFDPPFPTDGRSQTRRREQLHSPQGARRHIPGQKPSA